MKLIRYEKLLRSMKVILGFLVLPAFMFSIIKSSPVSQEKVESTEETVEVKEEPKVEPLEEKRWVCENCTENEKIVLKFLQDRGITDKVSLSVIMGNIKQESKFHSNICEGGARVPYNQCHRGGFGLIQWTTSKRYNGLGQFARRYGGDPTDLNTQLRWMVNEREWIKVEHIFKTPGLSVDRYMHAAYDWLGWGVHGERTTYSNQYLNRLVQV